MIAAAFGAVRSVLTSNELGGIKMLRSQRQVQDIENFLLNEGFGRNDEDGIIVFERIIGNHIYQSVSLNLLPLDHDESHFLTDISVGASGIDVQNVQLTASPLTTTGRSQIEEMTARGYIWSYPLVFDEMEAIVYENDSLLKRSIPKSLNETLWNKTYEKWCSEYLLYVKPFFEELSTLQGVVSYLLDVSRHKHRAPYEKLTVRQPYYAAALLLCVDKQYARALDVLTYADREFLKETQLPDVRPAYLASTSNKLRTLRQICERKGQWPA